MISWANLWFRGTQRIISVESVITKCRNVRHVAMIPGKMVKFQRHLAVRFSRTCVRKSQLNSPRYLYLNEVRYYSFLWRNVTSNVRNCCFKKAKYVRLEREIRAFPGSQQRLGIRGIRFRFLVFSAKQESPEQIRMFQMFTVTNNPLKGEVTLMPCFPLWGLYSI